MSEKLAHEINIPTDLVGKRLDQALAISFPQYSRSQIKTWIDTGNVTINGTPCRPKDRMAVDDRVQMVATLAASAALKAQDVPFEVILEDEHLIIVDKPAGLVVHPGAGNSDRTLANGLLYKFPELAALPRAGLIHRLDKETSGLLIVARHNDAFHRLTELMSGRAISRKYLALCNGVIIAGGRVEQPIGRDPRNCLKMKIRPDGRHAVTHYRVAEKFRAHTLLDLALETGRTHQIRVHMAHLGHPVVGDTRYGARMKLPNNPLETFRQALSNLSRHILHAKTLSFQHPFLEQSVNVDSPVPAEISSLLRLATEDQQQSRT
ncbi:MAG: 23S rRNA pseudouridine(1911/1915/1917) synthase RluD [Gammaproteobacteria bacterium]